MSSFSHSPPSRSLDHRVIGQTSPGFHGQYQHPNHSPLPHPAHHHRVVPANMFRLHPRVQSRDSYSQSAPSSPNGDFIASGHSQFLFHQQPLFEYPENEAIEFGYPSHLNSIKSLPTTPNGMSPAPMLNHHSVQHSRHHQYRQHHNGPSGRQSLPFRDTHSDHLPQIPRTAPIGGDSSFGLSHAYGVAASNAAYHQNGPATQVWACSLQTT